MLFDFKKIYYFLWLIRITIIIPIFFVGLCSSIICKNNSFDLNYIFLLLIPTLLAASGFILNDILDIQKDRINNPRKPLPSNSLSFRTAYTYFFTLLAISIILTFEITTGTIRYLLLFSIILTLSYSSLNRINGALGNFITSLLSTLPWIIPALYLNKMSLIVIPSISCFFLIFSREILLDVKDLRGDKKQNFNTIPIMFSIKTALLISFTLLLILNVILIGNGIAKNFGFLYFTLITMSFIIPTIIFLNLIMKKKVMFYLEGICHVGKIQFLIGIFAFLLTK